MDAGTPQVCELREGLGSTTNNVAEYRAFILGLRGALDRGIYRVRVQGDSKLVCEQVIFELLVKLFCTFMKSNC